MASAGAAPTPQEQLDALFGKLDSQLKNRQAKRALKTTDESELLGPPIATPIATCRPCPAPLPPWKDCHSRGCTSAQLAERGRRSVSALTDSHPHSAAAAPQS